MAKKFTQLAVEKEIAGEIASTLGRIGRELTKFHQKAWRAMERWEGCPAGASALKKRLERALLQAMDEAEEFRYYLIVQREAMGLRDHTEVARKYPLPKIEGRKPAAGDPTSPRLAFPGVFLRGRRRRSFGESSGTAGGRY
ncbi:MAG: hypothetical protein V3U53_03940 [bacterium]